MNTSAGTALRASVGEDSGGVVLRGGVEGAVDRAPIAVNGVDDSCRPIGRSPLTIPGRVHDVPESGGCCNRPQRLG
jgi:hypothetical protein